jgi:hypothetical protein
MNARTAEHEDYGESGSYLSEAAHLKTISIPSKWMGLEFETIWRSYLPVNCGEGFSPHLDHRGIAGYSARVLSLGVSYC